MGLMNDCEFCYLCECCPAAFDYSVPCPFACEEGYVQTRRAGDTGTAPSHAAFPPCAPRARLLPPGVPIVPRRNLR